MACSFGLLNCRSVCNKSVIVKDYIVDRNFDIFAITETWLRWADSDEVVIGYVFHHIPRETRGGGVGIMLKRSLDAEIHRTGTSYTSFEAIGVHLKVFSRDIYILVIYRPPSSSGISSMNIFMEEFSSCFEHYVIKPGSLMIAGDFNLHIDRLACSAGGFGGFHLSSVKPPFWFRCRLGELGRESDARMSEGVEGGEAEAVKFKNAPN